jgi:hypothetical protein
MLANLFPDLTLTCLTHIESLLADFEEAPSRTGFFDIGAVAEILVLSDVIPEMKPLVQPVRDAAAGWLKSGLLEDVCFSRVEFVYHAALLTYLARHGKGFCAGDMAVMRRLCEGRLVGRSEMPILSQNLVAAYFSQCDIAADFGALGERNMAAMIDKRVLRARSDEYDILVLLMCAQLHHLGAGPETPALYPHVLLVQAIRSADPNRLAVLAFLCARWFGLPEYLQTAVSAMVRENQTRTGLLPLPNGSGSDSDYIERTARGLRIRGTVALLSSLHALGDSHANRRTCLAVS